SIALTSSGAVQTWGRDADGQISQGRVLIIAAPALVLDQQASSARSQRVTEFYNPRIGQSSDGFGHYFVTASSAEATGIDRGNAGPGWERTGRGFRAWFSQSDAPAGAVPVCRFYAFPPTNSHFYTADAAECQQLQSLNPNADHAKGWIYESIAF